MYDDILDNNRTKDELTDKELQVLINAYKIDEWDRLVDFLIHEFEGKLTYGTYVDCAIKFLKESKDFIDWKNSKTNVNFYRIRKENKNV